MTNFLKYRLKESRDTPRIVGRGNVKCNFIHNSINLVVKQNHNAIAVQLTYVLKLFHSQNLLENLQTN